MKHFVPRFCVIFSLIEHSSSIFLNPSLFFKKTLILIEFIFHCQLVTPHQITVKYPLPASTIIVAFIKVYISDYSLQGGG